jgi:hypothetical protein
VFIMTGVRAPDGGEDAVALPSDLTAVEQAIADIDAALLIVDPLMAYLGADTNAHRDQDVRRALAPLAAMLERTKCAGLLIRHLNKAQAGSPLYRGGGSIGIIGAARFGLLVARDPEDDEARILAPTKCNIGPHPPALRFRLEGVSGTDVARVVWDDRPVTIDATGLLAAAGDDEERSALGEAGGRGTTRCPARWACRAHAQARQTATRRPVESRGLRPRLEIPLVPAWPAAL